MDEHKNKPSKTDHRSKVLPSQLNIGDVVLVSGHRLGIVRFIGEIELDSKLEEYAGIELKGHRDEKYGTNGFVNGQQYFRVKHQKSGIFVKSVARVIPSEELLLKVAELNEKLLVCTCGAGDDGNSNIVQNMNVNGIKDASENGIVRGHKYTNTFGGQLDPNSSSDEENGMQQTKQSEEIHDGKQMNSNAMKEQL